MKFKPEKFQAWTGFEPMTCDTGVVLYKLSYQANWELVTLWIRDMVYLHMVNIPVEIIVIYF